MKRGGSPCTGLPGGTRIKPHVSIALPVYNGERYISSTIESILGQTYPDFELIVADNASTDRTAEICARYAQRDPRVTVLRNARNVGAAANYTLATLACRGDYIKHAAHDDLLAPTYLERCVEVLDRDPTVVLAYPLSVHIDERGDRLPAGPGKGYRIRLDLRSKRADERFREYHHNCNEHSGADPVFGLIRAAALLKTSIMGSYIGSDLILLAELALLGRFVEIPEELFSYRLHPNNSGRANRGRGALGAWFSPDNRGRLRNQLFHWEWLYRYLAAVMRTPMSRAEKIGCYRQMPRWIWRHRGRLAGDLAAGAAHLAGHVPVLRHAPVVVALDRVHQSGET